MKLKPQKFRSLVFKHDFQISMAINMLVFLSIKAGNLDSRRKLPVAKWLNLLHIAGYLWSTFHIPAIKNISL